LDDNINGNGNGNGNGNDNDNHIEPVWELIVRRGTLDLGVLPGLIGTFCRYEQACSKGIGRVRPG
jgi:hypothetical protein